MKKNTWKYSNAARSTFLSFACMATVLACSCTAASANGSSAAIGSEAAQNYAFADAGVGPVSAETLFTEYDYEDGQFVYDVEFTADGTEYEYRIGASDGSVLKKSIEYLTVKNALYASSTANTADTAFSLEDAKDIALTDTGLTEEELALVTYTKEKSDYDDGLSVYDIEFYTDTTEYEYEISVATGEILSMPAEIPAGTGTAGTADTNANSSDTSSSYLSVDDAKAIALEKAGLSESDVTFKKAKLDKDDGIMVYEIEFYQGRTEYECTLDASTGAIIEFETDWDD
ncbi:MAG: PepSY domain-containing protein [Lachnospiraceae bacterium]|nr:PepSY domain-containing protein [Lachnospiraceae bacterium]